MRAMERTSRQAKVEELKAVAEKLPAANVLLLRRLLSLLQHIGHNASTSRMSASNLAICVGPNLLSPANENTLTLEAMVQVTEKSCLQKRNVALQATQTWSTRQRAAWRHHPLYSCSGKQKGQIWSQDWKQQRSGSGNNTGHNYAHVACHLDALVMDATRFFVLVVQSIIQLLQTVCDELGEATCGRVQQRAEQLRQEMARLLQELEQSAFAWGDLLLAALQQWQLWATAGVLVLLFGLCWRLRRRSRQPASSSQEESCSSNTGRKEEKSGGDDSDDARCLFRTSAKRIRWSVQNLAYRSRVVEELVGDLLAFLQECLATSFLPVLQPAIAVGSAFEGWSPRGCDAVYRLLVPLKPPCGHTFCLELGTAGEVPKDSRVRVELECTCTRGQLVKNTLCFLHHPEEALRRNPAASLLGTLCTGSYLDVEKTAQWFQDLVRSAWGEMLWSHHYGMKVLPSSRSCKLQLTNASGRSLFVEMVFGVQQGDSDIFLSSQTTEAIFTPSTTWAESYAVAEVKFFRHIARQAPHEAFHLQCLQLFAGILVGTGFSTCIFKTVAMHLLNTIPPSSWSRREFLMRLQDMLWYLRSCLEEKHLDHFFFGNENMPQDIILPPAFQMAEPLNLFQHLEQDPAAHAKAMRECDKLQDRLTRLLFHGQ
ncbi:inositol 1,4,5-trisphosphate receptor-interacting protein-like 1 [Pluvialis apricaria]